MITCAIIDDEPLALKLLSAYVTKTSFLKLEGTYSSALEAREYLMKSPVDLVFLDIQMPEMNGLELARFLPELTRIIYTTAFSQYAVDSYRVGAIDYLLKPISYADFLEAAERANNWVRLRTSANGSGSDTSVADTPTGDGSIFVKSEYKLIRISIEDILYVEGLKDYVKIYTCSHERPILSLMSMHVIEENLPADHFLRIHRSYIVNMKRMGHLERAGIGFGDRLLPISDMGKERVQQYISRRTLNSSH